MEKLSWKIRSMNTDFALSVIGEDKNLLIQALDSSKNKILELEQMFSFFLSNSQVSMINNAKKNQSIIVSEELMECLLIAFEVYNITQGSFDVCKGAFYKQGKVSSNGKFQIYPEYNEIEIVEEGAKIDLGGIAKGFALDIVKEILISDFGIENAFLNAGGSTILAWGTNILEEKPWQIKVNGQIIDIKDEAISASSNEDNVHIFFNKDNSFDSAQSNPINSICHKYAWAFCEKAAYADAFSTAFLILPDEKVNEITSSYPEIKSVLI